MMGLAWHNPFVPECILPAMGAVHKYQTQLLLVWNPRVADAE